MLVILIGLHLVAIFVAGVFGSSFNLSFWSSYERMGGIFDLAHWSALAAILIFTIRTSREWKILVGIYLAVSWIPALLGLAELYSYGVVDYFSIGWADGRIKGASGNPTFLAGQMAVNTALALALVASSIGSMRDRPALLRRGLVVFYGLTALVSIWVLLETGTRGSLLGMIAGVGSMVVLVAITSRSPGIRLASIAVMVAGVVVLMGLFVARDTALVKDLAGQNRTISLITDFSLDQGSTGVRSTGLRIAVEAFESRPITGWGGENFEVPYQKFQRDGEVPPKSTILDRAHNKPLDLLATAGGLGILTYAAVWIWLGALAIRRVRNEPDDRHFNIAVAGALIALFVHNLFLFDTATTLLIFALFAAWASRAERINVVEPTVDRDWLHLPPMASRSLRWAVPVVVVVVVFSGVYGVNWRTYRAAQLFTETGSTVEEIAGNLSRFSPLATVGRERLLNVMSSRWEEFDPFDRINLISELGEQADMALEDEPNNMELHFAVARFYRVASGDLPELLERARVHTDIGAELGPNTVSTKRALEDQAEAESDRRLPQPG